MRRRHWLMIVAGLVIAGLVAFVLKDVIYRMVILPLAYLWWVVKLYYHTIPQIFLWIFMLVLLVLILLANISGWYNYVPARFKSTELNIGPVENLGMWFQKSRSGTYFKWLIANRLGKIARDFLSQQGNQSARGKQWSLGGQDWNPSKPVERYLDAGLNRSFADYPNSPLPFIRPVETPFDLDVNEVVTFLEAQMEMKSGQEDQ